MADCMENCSRFWGKAEGCYGVVWDEVRHDCWIRNSTTSSASLTAHRGMYSALVKDGEMRGYDTKCPFPDASVQTLAGVDGLGYTVNCNKIVDGYDECFSSVPKPCLRPYFGFHHTGSLEQCLRICVDAQPLCRAVSWSPDLKIGFANCWLKNGFPDSGLATPPSNAGVLHSATITRIDSIDKNCPSSKSYVSSQGNKNFDIRCGQTSAGSSIMSIHARNLTSCMDSCAGSDKGCLGVVFDSTLNSGFRNCYLKNTTSTTSDQASATYAVINGTSTPSQSFTPISSTVRSKAWIAGPVLGGIALLCLVALFALWWRKRKAKKAGVAPREKAGGQYAPAKAYSPGYGYAGPPREMPASASAKYAHRGEATELPS